METEGDEGSHQHLESCKPTNYSQIPSTSTKDSILGNPNLPQELIVAILVRLPVKYLLQFKCVSKEWFALISSPEFVKTHLTFSAKDFTRHRFLLKLRKRCPIEYNLKHCSFSSLFYESVTETVELDYPMITLSSFRIVGSVDGLICVLTFNGLVLWNLSTRKFKHVPIFTQMNNPSIMYGFGYDKVRDDYKAVAVNCNGYAGGSIYSLKSDSWRTLDNFQGEMSYRSPGKLVNGKLHWVTVVNDGRRIMSIDLVDEKFGKVEQPCYGQEDYFLQLGVLGSDLSVLCSYGRTDVWVMKEYGVKESWTKLYTINNPTLPFSPTVCMSTEGELMVGFGSTLMIYNSQTGLMRNSEVTKVESLVEVELYIESLVSPMLQNGPMTQQ